ncbi:MAG TPA: HAMP domain-containing histidine kinase [Saprospiraceae bacterium]|nr:HAMP domain-containing histidine kinase [Saprospiraceae bacterium]
MDMYQQKSRWKIYLALAGILIITISMIFTNFLVNSLKQEEQRKVALFVQAYEEFNSWEEEFEDCDYAFLGQYIISNQTIPVILVNERGKIVVARNYSEERDTNIAYLESRLKIIQEGGYPPIEGNDYQIFYEDSKILGLLTYFPLFQFILIAAFIFYGYLGINSSRRAEQNRVWAGMAKETAHQLGTPISAIIAWIEHLRLIKEGDEEVEEILDELNNDVNRLNLIADRFSKIGSTPKLEAINVYDELEKCRIYMQRRAPRKVVFEFPNQDSTPLNININPPLFDWVVENLLRNALDAMGGTGTISAKVSEESKHIVINISDSGKGIPSNKFKTVFEPGFTTKKRGWGLGLSLAKRIIESYHSGKIFVKKSIINEGTTFTIKLPKN